MPSRRSFLRAGLAAGATTAILPTALHPGVARAQALGGTDYKALIAVWALGGMDGHDAMLPLDPAVHAQFKAWRPAIFAGHEANQNSREIANLLELNDTNQNAHNGQRFGLAPELIDLHGLFEGGELAILPAVGPLIEPANRAAIDNKTVDLPKRLRSHNDQQLTWKTFNVEGATSGWAGKFFDALIERGASDTPDFLGMRLSANSAFVTGQYQRPFSYSGSIPQAGWDYVTRMQRSNGRNRTNSDEIREILQQHIEMDGITSSNYFMQDWVNANNRGAILTAQYREAVANLNELDTVFPSTGLGRQFKAVVDAIRVRETLGVSRQIFSTGLGGWDTHAQQANNVSGRFRELSGAIKAFRDAMLEIGMWPNVTVFTGSDFGRPLIENGSEGTDHAWANNHFITGGSVDGGRIVGQAVTNWDINDSSDAGQMINNGQVIPTTSVEQYAASLGEWWGLTSSEINGALPRLGNFSAGPVKLFQSAVF
ncbi:MAG: DUF1501 domain-containing protein [Pseudomonadota bacterium]